MQIYLLTSQHRGNICATLMFQSEQGANKRLLREKRAYNGLGYRIVSDEKKAGEYRYMKLSRKTQGGLYEYAYCSYSLETVLP